MTLSMQQVTHAQSDSILKEYVRGGDDYGQKARFALSYELGPNNDTVFALVKIDADTGLKKKLVEIWNTTYPKRKLCQSSADYYHLLTDFSKKIELDLRTEPCEINVHFNDVKQRIEAIEDKRQQFFNINNYDKVIQLGEEIITLCKEVLNRGTSLEGRKFVLDKLEEILYEEQAKTNEVCQIIEENLQKFSSAPETYYVLLMKIAGIYEKESKIDQARETLNKHIDSLVDGELQSKISARLITFSQNFLFKDSTLYLPRKSSEEAFQIVNTASVDIYKQVGSFYLKVDPFGHNALLFHYHTPSASPRGETFICYKNYSDKDEEEKDRKIHEIVTKTDCRKIKVQFSLET